MMTLEFVREANVTIMSGKVVRWACKVPWVNTPEISASRAGVMIQGAWPTLTHKKSIETIKAVLDEALAVHRRMAGKVT